LPPRSFSITFTGTAPPIRKPRRPTVIVPPVPSCFRRGSRPCRPMSSA